MITRYLSDSDNSHCAWDTHVPISHTLYILPHTALSLSLLTWLTESTISESGIRNLFIFKVTDLQLLAGSLISNLPEHSGASEHSGMERGGG